MDGGLTTEEMGAVYGVVYMITRVLRRLEAVF